MADISAIFGILLFLGITFPGMLIAWWALFPRVVARAQVRVTETPWRSFWLGLAALIIAAIPIVIFLVLPFGPAKFLGASLIVLALGFASLGAAGIAAEMGSRLMEAAGHEGGTPRAFISGALALELCAAFPLIGWFAFIPIAIIFSLGATVFAILNWMPKRRPAPQPQSAPIPEAPVTNVAAATTVRAGDAATS